MESWAAQPTPLFGREQDVAAACRQFLRPEVRLLTLTGPPGVGKTRLAVAIAAGLRDELVDGSSFVELAPVRDASLVVPTIASSFGLQELPDQSTFSALLGYLAGKQVLLVLDNFEQVLAAGPSIAELLTGCPDVKVLVTSRAPLHVRWEYEFPVPPLALPGPETTSDLAALARVPSIALFVERARAIRPNFTLTPADAPSVAEICVRVDGLPLAIELAAARVRALSPREILANLPRRLDLLAAGPRDLPPRHQTLRAAIGWSYQLLSDDDQAIFRRLAVFRGSFTVEAAAAVCSDPLGPDSEKVILGTIAAVERLIDASLVVAQPSTAEPTRYHLLETIREFAEDELGRSGALAETERRHARHIRDLGREAEPILWSGAREPWIRRLRAERDNLRAAFATCARDPGLVETGLELAGAIWWFWVFQGQLTEGRRSTELTLTHDLTATPTRARAKALLAAGSLTWLLGDYVAARRWLEESAAIAEALGERTVLGYALTVLGRTWGYQGEAAVASSFLARGEAIFRELDDPWGLALTLFDFGDATLSVEPPAARRRLEESLARFRRLGDSWGTSLALTTLGQLALQRRDYLGARAHVEEALALRRSLDHPYYVAISLASLGDIARCQRDFGSARDLYSESLALNLDLGNQRGVAWAKRGLGRVALAQGRLRAAVELLQASLDVERELGAKPGLAEAVAGLAGVLVQLGKLEAAAEMFGGVDVLVGDPPAALGPAEEAAYEQDLATLKARFGAAALAAGRARGRAMTIDQVLSRAMALYVTTSPPGISAPNRGRGASSLLSAREREVAALVARGMSNREIAQALVIAEGTANLHVKHILTKLGLSTRTQVAVWAIQAGLPGE